MPVAGSRHLLSTSSSAHHMHPSPPPPATTTTTTSSSLLSSSNKQATTARSAGESNATASGSRSAASPLWSTSIGRYSASLRGAAVPGFPWRPRLPRFLTVLYVVLSASICGFLTDVIVLARSSCDFSQIGGTQAALAASFCVWGINIANRTRSSVTLIAFVAVKLHFLYKLWHVLCYQRHKLPAWMCRALRLEKRADAWVSAASMDLFDETVRFLQSTNLLLGGLMVPFTATFGVALSFVSYADYIERESHPELLRQCGTDDLCHFAKCYISCLMALNTMLLASASVCIHSVPAVVWSDTMERAMRKTNNRRVQRLMWLPYLCSLGYMHILFLLMHQQTRLLRQLNIASALEVKVNFFMQLATCAFLLWIVWLNMLLQDMATYLWSIINRRQALFSRAGRAASDVARRGRLPSVGQSISDASASHRRETLVLILLVLWSSRVLPRTPMWELVVVMLLRVLGLVILVAIRERPSNFHTIEEHAGFGLVVKASELKRRLSKALERDGCSAEWELPTALAPTAIHPSEGGTGGITADKGGGLPMYKATLYRMRDTLAVSYRWQEEDTRVSDHIRINMNEFQMRALVTAIERSRCQYVWLDRLSVPQDDCPLKFTILARMMAVYAAAGATVALRTAETDGSRYHQRVWTFPEYCASTNLHVVTQDTPAESPVRAVAGDEEQTASRLREGLQSLRVDLVPMWLRESNYGMTADEAAIVLMRYRWLAANLRCKFPEDKIRALLPLVMRTPVESQGELAKLVLLLSKASGEELQDWKVCLFEQHLDRQRAAHSHPHLEKEVHPLLPPTPTVAHRSGWVGVVARTCQQIVGLKRNHRALVIDIPETSIPSPDSDRKNSGSRTLHSLADDEDSESPARKAVSAFDADDKYSEPALSPVLPFEYRAHFAESPNMVSRISHDHGAMRRSISSFNTADSRRTSLAESAISAVSPKQAREMRRARLEHSLVHGGVSAGSFSVGPSFASLPGGVPELDRMEPLVRLPGARLTGGDGLMRTSAIPDEDDDGFRGRRPDPIES